MTLQDTRSSRQILDDFYNHAFLKNEKFGVGDGRANSGVPQYNGLFQEAQKNKRMATEIFSGLDPEDFESAFSVAQTPRGDATPIYFDKHMGGHVPRPFGPQQFPEYMQAGGPSLFPIIKDFPGEVKGTIRGVQGGSRNDLSKPYGGLRKAGMLFENQGLFA